MRGALSFLTCLGGPVPPTPKALSWFPLIGAGIGLSLGGLHVIAGGLWPPLLAATIVVAADLIITGMLHLDGLADSADGLLAHGLDPARRLAVMAEPTSGAFALGTVTLAMVLRVVALAALAPSPVLLAVLWATSRAAMALAVQTQPYVRPQGLASTFRDSRSGRDPITGVSRVLVLVLVLVLAVAGGLAWWDEAGIGVGDLAGGVVSAVLAAVVVLAVARRRIGGYTGDVLGAAGMLAETTGLVVVAARW
jgi:adenosylcobinamide-GDP ribazoletransferase